MWDRQVDMGIVTVLADAGSHLFPSHPSDNSALSLLLILL